MIKVLSVILLGLLSCSLFAQNEGNGDFVQYRYENGNVSSEGFLVNGKPDGYWKSYYENGTLKSEGNRLFFELDSIWKFYYQSGELQTEIYYRNGQRNGYTQNYSYFLNKDSVQVHYLESQELYLNGLREGVSYYYCPEGYILYSYPYKNDKRSGEGYEYDKDGNIISIITYHRGYLIDKIKINRIDEKGQKQGRWIEFYPSGVRKNEVQYTDGKINGIYRKYDASGRAISEQRFVNGEPFTINKSNNDEKTQFAELRTSYFPNGNIQTQGAFLNDMPVGIHNDYDESGKIIRSREYTFESVLLGEGLFDEKGKRTGLWKLYDAYNEYYYAQGSYKSGKKNDLWKYFYKNGNKELEGSYDNDKPDGEWVWLYPNGNKRRIENYYLGKQEGLYIEYDSLENEVVKGEYFDGEKKGQWRYVVGEIIECGNYDEGQKTGTWKHYYIDNNKTCYVGKYSNGDAVGVHRWYYHNGTSQVVGEYRGGQKHNTWRKYNTDGSVYMTYTYRYGELIKIDGVNLEKSRRVK